MQFAGLSLDSPRLMGVVNVTPDSFSDGGEAFATADGIARGRVLSEHGADIIDVGGESTRPGAEPVPEDEELRRVMPVIRALAADGNLVSIDSRRPAVMRSALDAGARIVNDVTALRGDPRSMEVVAEAGASVVLMHMRGDPRTMQDNPRYGDVVMEIRDELAARVEACVAAGIHRGRIAVDPGIGFGKTADHNVRILARLDVYEDVGVAVVIGVSRKSFIARLSRNEAAKRRLPGSLAAGLAAIDGGAHILRVHDVAETRQALTVWSAVAGAR